MKAMKYIRFFVVELLFSIFIVCMVIGTLTVCPIMLLSLWGGLTLYRHWDERGQLPDFLNKYYD